MALIHFALWVTRFFLFFPFFLATAIADQSIGRGCCVFSSMSVYTQMHHVLGQLCLGGGILGHSTDARGVTLVP